METQAWFESPCAEPCYRQQLSELLYMDHLMRRHVVVGSALER